jgi:sugar lactone lactonase YvrE
MNLSNTIRRHLSVPDPALAPVFAKTSMKTLDTYVIINSEASPRVEPERFPLAKQTPYCQKSAPKPLFLMTLARKVGGGRGVGVTAALFFVLSTALLGQGILSVTPSRTVTTEAGTGVLGDTGDTGQAASATLANPSAVAYDANGNLYLADAQNHVIREVSKAGVITTVAGTQGTEGYGGDNGPATSAILDTPTGVAVDANGNIFIADSHNQRIREVSSGTITTIAGTGTAGFSGDGAAATAAQLALPSSVAVDSSGNVYIADTNNHRIRKITGTTISTIAGDGEELFSGDGAAATAAVLDSPTGVAVDKSGNVYIADRHNQRIREITGTTISTIAGSGTAGFSGDGATATNAQLFKPSGVSVDASGNVYIADTGNQRIRELGGGAIATIAGSGQQGYGGDTTAPSGVNLNSPKAVAPDALGNLAISDKLNERIRAATLPTLTYTSDGVGILSPTQSVTLANTGTASISVATITLTGPFTTAAGGTCSAPPITLAANATCTENVAFLPVAVGADTGSIAFSGTGVVPQTILLAGTAVQTATTVLLTSSLNPAFIGTAVTFTAVVTPTGAGTPTKTVAFYDGATLLSTQTLAAGSNTATFATTTLIAGAHSITAVYSGDANYITSTSNVVVQTILDFNFALYPPNSGGGSQTITPGQAATFDFSIQPIGGPFSFPVELTATGLPPGATVTFTPNPITLGATASSFTMTIQTAKPSGALNRRGLFGGGTIALGLLLLPFSRRLRRKAGRLRSVSLCLALLLSLAAISGLTGCGTGSGFFGESQQTYTITVTGTAIGTGAVVLQHSTTVTLTVE